MSHKIIVGNTSPASYKTVSVQKNDTATPSIRHSSNNCNLNIIINCSCLHEGGGLQVAESIISYLGDYPQHKFIAILSDELQAKISKESVSPNVSLVTGASSGLLTILTGRHKQFDKIVKANDIDCVLTVFGPSRWKPRVPSLCGFARSHVVMLDYPYFKRMPWIKRLKNHLYYSMVKWDFDKSSDALFTENEMISKRLRILLPKHEVWTVTNNYNQVFDNSEKWQSYRLPDFDGLTMLCVTAAYPHKNLEISIEVARELKTLCPNLDFRFVFTVTSEELVVPDELKKHFNLIGRVGIEQCPSLYQQADIMFQPTLLECFSATYAEAMRMGTPIVTTDLDFARGLCKDAAMYYDALNASDAAHAILKVSEDIGLRETLISNGRKVLAGFDTAKQRADKLIAICENLANASIAQ